MHGLSLPFAALNAAGLNRLEIFFLRTRAALVGQKDPQHPEHTGHQLFVISSSR